VFRVKTSDPPFAELYVTPLFKVLLLAFAVRSYQIFPEPGYEAVLLASKYKTKPGADVGAGVVGAGVGAGVGAVVGAGVDMNGVILKDEPVSVIPFPIVPIIILF